MSGHHAAPSHATPATPAKPMSCMGLVVRMMIVLALLVFAPKVVLALALAWVGWNYLKLCFASPMLAIGFAVALYTLVWCTLAVNGQVGDVSRNVLSSPIAFFSYIWEGLLGFFGELWGVVQHFVDECHRNGNAFPGGPGHSLTSEIFRKTLGNAMIGMVALFKTIVWWVWHGHAITTIIKLGLFALVGYAISQIAGAQFTVTSKGHGGGGGGHH